MLTEEAVSLETKKATDGKWLVLLAAFLGWMFDGLEMGIFPLVAGPALKEFFHGDAKRVGEWMGIITALFLLGAAAGGLIFGWLGDRIGRVRAMSLSVLAYSVFTGLGYFATEAWHLGALRFVAALGMGGEWSLGVALVMEIWPEKSRPLLAGAIGAASNVGFAIIGLIGYYFPIKDDSWRWVMLVGTGPALLTFLIRLFVPESERWKNSVKQSAVNPLKEVFTPPLLSSMVLGIVFASIALIGTWGSVQWIPLWVSQQLAPGEPKAKAMIQIFSALGAVTGCLIAPMAGKILGRRITYFGLCLASLGTTMYLFTSFSQYDTNFKLMVFVVGCMTASFYGWLPLYLPELFPTRVRATGQGVSFNAGRILAAAGTMYAGQLVAYYGGSYAKMCQTIVLVYILGLALIWLAPETKDKPLPE